MRTQDEIRTAFVARAVTRARHHRRMRRWGIALIASLGLLLAGESAALSCPSGKKLVCVAYGAKVYCTCR